MKEIRFKGKCLDNGEWVCGFYAKVQRNDYDIHLICNSEIQYADSPPENYLEIQDQVDPETVEMIAPEPRQLTLDELESFVKSEMNRRTLEQSLILQPILNKIYHMRKGDRLPGGEGR